MINEVLKDLFDKYAPKDFKMKDTQKATTNMFTS